MPTDYDYELSIVSENTNDWSFRSILCFLVTVDWLIIVSIFALNYLLEIMIC